MSRLSCKECGEEMNIAEGTFGYGRPKECPKCKSANLENIGAGWRMSDGSIYPELFEGDNKNGR